MKALLMPLRPSFRKTTAATLLASCLILPGIAGAILKTDPAKSSVSLVFKQMNVPVEAKFKKFSAQIDFNRAKPEASKARVDIDVPSFDLGDPEYNKEVLKKEWLNAAQFPNASFVSSTITPTAGAPAGSKFDVSGKLSIKGKTQDVRFPLSVKTEGAQQVFEGTLPIQRLAFNIGEGEWKDTSMVADQVLIKFRVIGTE
jgi:polyisoprenoid-binding protein YceI